MVMNSGGCSSTSVWIASLLSVLAAVFPPPPPPPPRRGLLGEDAQNAPAGRCIVCLVSRSLSGERASPLFSARVPTGLELLRTRPGRARFSSLRGNSGFESPALEHHGRGFES